MCLSRGNSFRKKKKLNKKNCVKVDYHTVMMLTLFFKVDSYYCPNCLENMPSAEAKVKKNR